MGKDYGLKESKTTEVSGGCRPSARVACSIFRVYKGQYMFDCN